MGRNIGSSKQLEIHGVQDLLGNIEDIIAGLKGTPGRRAAVTRRASEILGKELHAAAVIVRDETKRRAISQNWPHEAIAGIFAYFDPNKPKRSTALAGVSKRRSMVEWYPGKSKSPRAKVAPGTVSAKGARFGAQKIAMSLATMFEYGTSKMNARPAYRPALASVRASMLARMAQGYKKVIESFAWAKTHMA